jgi:peptidoglycan/LPS O-acetylase OafA/YrhL
MLGTFRLVLAALVALSHFLPTLGIPVPSINFGAAAVVCFYFISGYLMCLSFGRFRERARDPTRAFYIDRVFRLCPSYFVAYGAASLWLFFGFGLNIFSSFEWISEVLIIPANYTLLALPLPAAAAANPPTWSLGAEFQFYLLLPPIMMLGRRMRAALLIILLAGQIVFLGVSGPVLTYAPWCQAIGPYFCYFPVSDLLVYRWLPLAMAPFLLGTVLAEQASERWIPWPLAATAAVYFCVFLASESGAGFHNPSSLEVTSATALFVPIAYIVLTKFSSRNRWDRMLGNLAYPLFLDHILCLSITGRTGVTGWRSTLIFTLLAVVISSAIAVFQIGIDRLRYRWRGFGALARTGTQDAPNGGQVFVKA